MKELIKEYTARIAEVEEQKQLALKDIDVNNPLIVQLCTLQEAYKEFVENLTESLKRQEEEEAITMAQQQLTGYIMHMQGGREKELIESMNLTIDEWATIREEAWIPANLYHNINAYFSQHKKLTQ